MKTAVSWNWYHHSNSNKTFNQLQPRRNGQQKNDDPYKENLPVIFCRVPYAGTQGDRLVKNLKKKRKWIVSQPFISKSIYKTTNMSYYWNKKERIPDNLKSHAFYEFAVLHVMRVILVK